MEIVLNLLILTVLVIITYNLFSKNKKSNASIDSDLSNEITNLRVQLGVKDEKIRSLKESKELESENLKKDTLELFDIDKEIEVIPNFICLEDYKQTNNKNNKEKQTT